MSHQPSSPDQTNTALLAKLKDTSDAESWQSFHDHYAGLLLGTALRFGLIEADAQDVVQETLSKVAQQIGAFHYDRTQGRFRDWLLTILRRHVGQLRRRQFYKNHGVELPREQPLEAGIEATLCDSGLGLETAQEAEWQLELLERALAQVQASSDPRHFEMFERVALQGCSVSAVCEQLGCDPDTVYRVKNRLTDRLKQAIAEIQAETP